jgi:hypothetical protein
MNVRKCALLTVVIYLRFASQLYDRIAERPHDREK